MDQLFAIGSALPARQVRSLANRDVESAVYVPATSPTEPNSSPAAALDLIHGSDPATEQQRMLHFISHIDAECFISLLQILDPKPDDYRARAEYQRHYRQLRETLEVPLPPQDTQPVRT
jgi:hypothetical protein